ncbi:MAG: A24 family peptidase [Endomicrobium sp.]|uniref:prepilin peptidase n=1 Tax=Candidatus Endomicrobiellum pyrsonymphae TaxID=1408203 RepID=UPI0035785671|nr:A24 family peptidase [Endomicrobium sp.]
MAFSVLGIILVFYIGVKVGNSIYKTSLIRFFTACSFSFLFYKFSFSITFFLFAFLTYSLVSVSAVDYFHRIIPAIFPILLIVIGVVCSFLNVSLGETSLSRFLNSMLGIISGSGVLFIVGFFGQLLCKREVIGDGDVKLMAGVGAFIGWEKALFSVFIAAVLGSIVGLALIICRKMTRRDYMPFGPFLSATSIISIFLPQPSSCLDIFFVWEAQVFSRILGA